jgi:hypothetical protein
MRMQKMLACLVLVGASALLPACRTNAQTGSVFGAGLGSAVGAIIGNNSHGRTTNGALIGAGAGAILGYAVGNEMDKEQRGTHYAGDPRYEPGYSAPPERVYVVDAPPRVERVYYVEEPPPRERVIYRETRIYEGEPCPRCR